MFLWLKCMRQWLIRMLLWLFGMLQGSKDDELALTKSLVQRALLKPTMGGEDDDREMRETGRPMMGGGGLGRV